MLCLTAAGPALAQEGDKVEINLFGGNSSWAQKQTTQQDGSALGLQLVNGSIFGVRVDENIWSYVALEESFGAYGVNNTSLYNVPGVYGNEVSFGSRLRQFSVGPLLYLNGPEHRFRPFVTAQIGLNYLTPTSKARDQAANTADPLFGAAGPISLGNSWKQGFNYTVGLIQYGAGFKIKFTDRIGFRTDVRGNIIQTPSYHLPRTGPPGTITLAEGGAINGYQATAGFTLYFGKSAPPPPHTFSVPAAIDGPAALCPGETATLKIPSSDSYGNHTPKYKWTVNGQDQNTNAAELTVKAPDSGDLTVTVHVEADTASYSKQELHWNKKQPATPADRSLTIHTKEYKAPTLACSANPTELNVGDSSTITGTATGSDCSGTLRYTWSATEGSVTGDATATYSSTGVQVEAGGSKQVTVNGTVTDAKNGTAQCSVPLTIKAPAAAAPVTPPVQPPAPKATQLDDIIFAPNSSRVNNCGKRVLEDLYKQMAADPDATIVLVGHEDAKEAKASKHRRHLDEERVLNTAAVLSAGTGKCQKLELSRIQVAWVGSVQDSEFKTRFCEASVVELKGQAAGNDSEAKNRRVEIWIVPKGTETPSAAKGIHAAPDKAVKSKGCPK